MTGKKLTLIIVFSALYYNLFAQNSRISASIALNKFVGTWVSKKNGKEFKIILKKIQEKLYNQDVTIDVIEGYHIYNVDNRDVENTLESNRPALTLGGIEEREKPNKLKIIYFDSIKKKSCNAILIFLPGDTAKIQWTLQNREGVRVHKPGKPGFDRSFTLPETMILTKEQ